MSSSNHPNYDLIYQNTIIRNPTGKSQYTVWDSRRELRATATFCRHENRLKWCNQTPHTELLLRNIYAEKITINQRVLSDPLRHLSKRTLKPYDSYTIHFSCIVFTLHHNIRIGHRNELAHASDDFFSINFFLANIFGGYNYCICSGDSSSRGSSMGSVLIETKKRGNTLYP